MDLINQKQWAWKSQLEENGFALSQNELTLLLQDASRFAGVDILHQLQKIENDAAAKNRFLDAVASETNFDPETKSVAEPEPEKLADPFTFFLTGSAVLYLFSVKWGYSKEDGFRAEFPGLSPEQVAELLKELFSKGLGG